LGFCSLVVFFRACDRSSVGLAVVAGLLAGLAAQTKYTGLLAPATILLYALVFRRVRLGVLAASVATAAFCGWEGFMAFRYGESHFLHSVHTNEATLASKALLSFPLLAYLGGTAPGLGLIALLGLRVRSRSIALLAAAILLGDMLLALVPAAYQSVPWSIGPFKETLHLSDVIFGATGILVSVSVLIVLGTLLRVRRKKERQSSGVLIHPKAVFLGLWLALELGGYYTLSPFPASRRILGLVVVATLIAGRLATSTCHSPSQERILHAVVLGTS